MKTSVETFNKLLKDKSAKEILEWAFGHFGVDNIALSSSLGAEDQVLTDMIVQIKPKARIFTLDTGRLHQETYDVISKSMEKYGIKYEVLFPETKDIEAMEANHGPNLFYENIDKRKLCCEIRKIRPLKRILSTLDAWICGLRRSQNSNRTGIEKIEWDDNFGLMKLNPLADWTDEDVWTYIRKHNVPYNSLHDLGYPSIGCAPCTRAVKAGEDTRSGRWGWEESGKKECGLHLVNGKLTRSQ